MTAPVDMFDLLEALDEQLAAVGFPRMSPLWRKTMKRWLRSRKRWLVARIGRRGGKGLMSAKLAILFALYAVIVNLSPGERAYVELLSVDKDEAAARLRMIAAGFKALGIEHHPVGEEISLTDPTRPVTIRVRAASVRAVGGTAILILEDEVSRWRDSATGANPAREIHSSISAELLSQPEGRGCVFSAPFSENDFHAQKYDEGETAGQCVAFAPTWIANPTISEADTKALEPDPRVHAREYGAQPIASVTSICGREELASVTAISVPRRPRVDGGRHAMTLDPAFKHDRFVATVWHRELREGPNGEIVDTIVQDAILHLIPTFLRKVALDDATRQVVDLCRAYGITVVDSDGHYSEALSPRFQEHAIRLEIREQTSKAITARIENLQARIHTNAISLLDHAEQTKEILAAQLIAHTGGRLTLKAPERRGAHDDLVSAILLACDVESVAKLPPCAGEIEIEYGAVHFDHETRSIQGGGARYYRRQGDGRVPCEPPFGTRAFIRYAQLSIASGVWTESIRRWAIDLGLDPVPGLDPALLDPELNGGSKGPSVR